MVKTGFSSKINLWRNHIMEKSEIKSAIDALGARVKQIRGWL
jgi:hypothetical protein